MRYCANVIDQMLEHIPLDQINLIERLKWCLNDAGYRPPEDQFISFNYTMEALQENILEIKEEWHFKVLSIFTNKTLEEYKEMYNNHMNNK